MPTATEHRTLAPRPSAGPVIVRIDANAHDWTLGLPSLPGGQLVGVTVGDVSLREDAEALALRGYDLIDVVAGRRPGRHADLLVTAALRDEHPRWFSALLLVADRVFDLDFGPVRLVLHDELLAHLPATDLD